MKCGFHTTTIHVYGELSPLQVIIHENTPGGPIINITSANEHAPYIEWIIRVIKYRTNSIRHRIPFNKTPKLLTIYIVFKFVSMINYLPVKVRVFSILSPKTIMSCMILHYRRHLGLKIGQYYQVN